jgi:hypothetical protein
MGKGERERERERLRQERLDAEKADKSSGRNRLIVGYAIVSTVVIAVVVAIVVIASGGGDDGEGGDSHINLNAEVGSTNGVQPDDRKGIVPATAQETDLNAAAKAAGCTLRLKLEDEGAEHLAQDSEPPQYGTNPPTSGPHVEPPYQQADGAYSEMPREMDLVHTLEHGRLEIQYAPTLPEQAQLELKGLYDTMYGATLLFPNPNMPYEVAATTWTNLIGCPTYKGAATLDAIRAFGKATWGKYGGEPAEAFDFTGPTPAKPNEPKS